ncbi:efflux RND transporter periplasmic adaptor subunit [Paraferrimonas sedimenticola]|uniref:MexH family multidrug efflux RND transporter periplasmic adaptor subunit n=1 Tax=Paraferrimonas sedimenticola TaxID=375674 RepID=A0AA37RYH3_9GAMM|nr:efflux RND transporter periplasmic adaptor subunit [Paraferrimonas sedimenticola]GLP97486.1 MexH family multidrug efflux RND transporter periplasmic adaptor subunit [Paraferrimonas sedimenticola]
MKKWILLVIVLAAVLFGSVIGFNFFVQGKMKEAIANMPEPEFAVTAQPVELMTWSPTIDAIGFVEPNQGVTLATETAGLVKSIDFENGTKVEQGQLLLTQNSQVEEANLKNAKVRLPAAESEYKRLNRLYKVGSVSKSDLDQAEAAFMALEADIESLNATIDKRQIKAPFAGLVGIRSVNLGEYLQAGTDIVRLEDISTMKIRFTIPQNELAKIAVGTPVKVYVDAHPEHSFDGAISAIEPAVFYQSGLIQVQATIPNNDGRLRSGMFSRVAIQLPELVDQVVLPETAINFTLYGNTVYVVEEDDQGQLRANQINVEVQERNGELAHVTSGLKGGQMVVTSGQLRLSNNSKVKIIERDVLTPADTMPQL